MEFWKLKLKKKSHRALVIIKDLREDVDDLNVIFVFKEGKKWFHFRGWWQKEMLCDIEKRWGETGIILGGKRGHFYWVWTELLFPQWGGGVLWISYTRIAALQITKEYNNTLLGLFLYFSLSNCLGWALILAGYLSLIDSSRNPGSFNLVAPTFPRATVITGSRGVLDNKYFILSGLFCLCHMYLMLSLYHENSRANVWSELNVWLCSNKTLLTKWQAGFGPCCLIYRSTYLQARLGMLFCILQRKRWIMKILLWAMFKS